MDQAQLDESLQQQQAVTQQMLDVMNEKIENWVCQCFSDLRNRIIELVGILAGFMKPATHGLCFLQASLAWLRCCCCSVCCVDRSADCDLHIERVGKFRDIA